MNSTTRIPLHELSDMATDAEPKQIDWLDEDRWRCWQTITYTFASGREATVVTKGRKAAAVFLADGTRIDRHDEPNEDVFTRAELRELRKIMPQMYGATGPMMNFWYPLPGGNDDVLNIGDVHPADAIGAAYLLRDLPLCVVEVDSVMGLALTGAGMDFTWEIVEAYTTLGYLPPSYFWDLPRMGNRGTSERDRYLIATVTKSVDARLNLVRSRLAKLQENFGPVTDHSSTGEGCMCGWRPSSTLQNIEGRYSATESKRYEQEYLAHIRNVAS
jgi:hypothetical protein